MHLQLEEIAKEKEELEELNRKMKVRAEKFNSAFRELTLEDFRVIKLQKARESGDAAYLKDLAVLEEISDPTEREKRIYERAKKFFTTIEVRDAEKFFEKRTMPDFTDDNVQFRENAVPNLIMQLHLYGVDYLSTDGIRNYFGLKYAVRIEWLNDSSCNIVVKSKELAGQLVEEFTRKDLPKTDAMKDESEQIWYEFRPYTVEGIERRLFARVATNKDVKNSNVSGKNSKYYEYVMSKLRLKKFVQNKAREALTRTKKIHKLSSRRDAKKQQAESSSSDAQSSSEEVDARQVRGQMKGEEVEVPPNSDPSKKEPQPQ